jgi:hypothetical protein
MSPRIADSRSIRAHLMAALPLLFTLAVAGCGSGRTISTSASTPGTSPGATALSLDRDLQPLLTARCALSGCHAGSSPQEGMDLSAGEAWRHLVNVGSEEIPGEMRVKPGDPDHSVLFEKISQDQPRAGTRMPQGAQPLSAEEIEQIRLWILGGALP